MQYLEAPLRERRVVNVDSGKKYLLVHRPQLVTEGSRVRVYEGQPVADDDLRRAKFADAQLLQELAQSAAVPAVPFRLHLLQEGLGLRVHRCVNRRKKTPDLLDALLDHFAFFLN